MNEELEDDFDTGHESNGEATEEFSPQFIIGDRVRLKSGGPRMVVEEYSATLSGVNWVDCVWFDAESGVGDPLRARFNEDVLFLDAPEDIEEEEVD
jgi:uncharacterized protein YodC (DUF2158 family)